MSILSIFYFFIFLSVHATTDSQQERPRLQKRVRRDFINFFGQRNDNKQYQTGNNSPIIQTGIDTATVRQKDLSDIIGQQTGRLIEGASEVVLTPVTWLAYVQKYWPLYLVCITIILGLLTFCYFSCQYKLAHLCSNNANNEHPALLHFLQQQQQQMLRNLRVME